MQLKQIKETLNNNSRYSNILKSEDPDKHLEMKPVLKKQTIMQLNHTNQKETKSSLLLLDS